MRKPSVYFSDLFLTSIWVDFSATLQKEKSRSDYFSTVCYICDELKKDFLDITLLEAQNYFHNLPRKSGSSIKLKTLHVKLSHLRSISSFIIENRKAYDIPSSYSNIFARVDLTDYDYYVDKESIPTLEEIDKMLSACNDNPMFFLLISFVFRCALTTTEVCKLQPKQIGEDAKGRGYILFQGKSYDRYVKVPGDVMKLLIDYVDYSGEREYLFYNQWGRVLSVRSAQSLFRDVLAKARIEKNYTLQSLRNASLIHMIHSGAKNEDIATYTGTDGRWLYRLHKVIPELDFAPCDYVHICIK